MRTKDITGLRVGKLVAVEPTPDKYNGSVIWRCRCDCGEYRDICVSHLNAGKTLSCTKCPRIPKDDITGKKYNRLTVLRLDGYLGHRRAWLCQCDCGKKRRVVAWALKKGQIKACIGCARKMRSGRPKGPVIQLAGQTFGRLKVIRWETSPKGNQAWQCLCDCGNTTWVVTGSLTRGNTRSCGCLRRETGAENVKSLNL